MISSVTSNPTAFTLPDNPYMNSASSTFFGTLMQENTDQFSTLDTANAIASVLGGKVVDMSTAWTGGSQTAQYGIQLTDGGPILNAGLIAKRCQTCGTETGLAAALQEAKSLAGQTMSTESALSAVMAGEHNYMTALQSAAAAKAAAAKPATAASPAPTAQTVATRTETAALATAAETAATSVSESVGNSTVVPSLAVPTRADTPAETAPTTPFVDPTITSTSSASAAKSTLATNSTLIPAASDQEKLQKSAKDFEALMIGQMLKTVRESSSGSWLESDSSSADQTAVEMAETSLAQSLASSNALGLANLVLKNMAKTATTSTTAPNSFQQN